MEAQDKTAAQILLELDSKVDQLLNQMMDLRFKYDLILNRLKDPKIVGQSLPEPENKISSEDVTFTEFVPEPLKPAPKAQMLKSKIQAALEASEKDQATSGSVEPEVASEVKQIPVQQKLLYPDGKPIYMANLEIFNSEKRLVRQTKTNQTGKWMLSLAPGQYQIKVSKSGNALKPKIETNYLIVVPNQDLMVDLGPKTLEGL